MGSDSPQGSPSSRRVGRSAYGKPAPRQGRQEDKGLIAALDGGGTGPSLASWPADGRGRRPVNRRMTEIQAALLLLLMLRRPAKGATSGPWGSRWTERRSVAGPAGLTEPSTEGRDGGSASVYGLPTPLVVAKQVGLYAATSSR